jgi:phosphatidylglycerophosphate synthase
MALRNSRLAAEYYRLVERHLLPLLLRRSLTPNQLTLAGLGLALLVPIGFFLHPGIGLCLMIGSAVADSLDGAAARHLGKASAYGGVLDSSLDRVSDACFLFGFWIMFWSSPKAFGAGALVFSALLFTFMISYVKARAEAAGGRCQKGLMERGLRTLYLIVWALLITVFPRSTTPLLWWGLGIYCLLTLGSVVERILHVRSELS